VKQRKVTSIEDNCKVDNSKVQEENYGIRKHTNEEDFQDFRS